jgi:cation transport regulator
MPGTVTVPDVLKGHAADIWRSAFLSSYDGTCKERGDQRDSCAASIAWAAVKNVYHKNDKGEWVEKAGDPTMGPLSAMNMAEFPSMNANVEQTTKKDPWLEAFMEALDDACAHEDDPWACAKQVADAEMAEKPEGEKLGVIEESTVGDNVGRMRSLHPNDYLDLSLPLVLRKDYSPEKRAEMAKNGEALPDGSYPIADRGDLMDAIHSFGRAPADKREQVKAHIRKRAKALGALEGISEEWGGKKDGEMEKKSTADEEVTEPVPVEAAPAETPEPEPVAGEAPAPEEPAVEKSAPVLTERAKRRMVEADRDAEVARTADLNVEVKGPDGMFYGEWYKRPLQERTLGAQLTERALARAYDEAVENAVANGWTALHNPVRQAEYFFQRYMETPDGLILTRSILTRRAGTMDWRLRELTRGAALSLSVQIPADERRQGDSRPFDLLPSRGGPGSGFYGHAGRPGERGGSAPGAGGEREGRFHSDVRNLANSYSTVQLRKMQDAAKEAMRNSAPGGPNEARGAEAQYASEILAQAVGKKEWSDWQVQYPSWMQEEDRLEQAKADFARGGEAMLPNYKYELTPSEGRGMAGLDLGAATEDVRADFENAGGYPGHITSAIAEGNVESAKSFAQDAALSSLAAVVESDWGAQGKGVNFAAKPYLEALASLDTIRDTYGADSGKSVVAYFLSNAGTWKGPTAKLVKAELNRRLKG